jgi:glycosyltransferase involved in cell wall biosynthesis
MMNAMPVFSVIICSINSWRFAQASECYRALLAAWPHEIIVIHDARSLAEGYNRGLKQSSGKIVIFSHDDILILDPAFGQKVQAYLQDFDLLGFVGASRLISARWFDAGPEWMHGVMAHTHDKHLNLSVFGTSPWPVIGGIQAIDGLCMMARRQAALETGFDERTFDGFHLYDLDFSYAAWRAGKKLGVCCDIPVIHASAGSYEQTHERYSQRFVAKYADALSLDNTRRQTEGACANFSSHHALLAAWQPGILQRLGVIKERNSN